MTYIYYIPASESESCNGTVTAVQMCYTNRQTINRHKTFGQFLLLTKSSSNFIVIKKFSLEAHISARACVRGYFCCEKMTLDIPNQFKISSLDDFGFGIRNIDQSIKPLQFKSRYVLSLHQRLFSSTPSKFLISSLQNVSATSLLLRFIVSELQIYAEHRFTIKLKEIITFS